MNRTHDEPIVHIQVRLDKSLHAALRAEAKRAVRSLNSEIRARLLQSLAAERSAQALQ
jgi:predicted HicB family RNase H-like nuclease